MADKQSSGRDDNAALPEGRRDGLVSEKGIRETGKESRKSAGPDGPDAAVVGDTFKTKP